MSKHTPNWKSIFALAVMLVGVVALLGHAGFTAAQEGADKGDPSPAAPALEERNAAPAGDPGTKNVSDDQAPTAPLAGGGTLRPCSATADDWTTTSLSPELVADCTVDAPGSGHLLIIANAWMRYDDDHYEAGFLISPDTVQAPAGGPTVARTVDVYGDSGDGTDRAFTLGTMRPVFTGTHTVSLVGWQEEGPGTVTADDVILSVLYIPDSSDIQVCSHIRQDETWDTNTDTYSTIASCSLNAPQEGWMYVMGNGTAEGLSAHPYEAQYSIDIDETDGELETSRWYNFYDDSYGDGTNGTVSVSALRHVPAGNHTINFLGKRWDGVPTVYLDEPTLFAVFIPTDSGRAQTCGATANTNWTTTSGTFESVISCGIEVPGGSWAFVSANGTLGVLNDSYEAQLRLGLDDTVGLDWTDLYYNITTDSGDGMDRPVSLTSVFPVAKGQHTFHLLGSRWTGPGDVLMRYPSISVVVPGADHFIPLLRKN